MNLDQKPQQNLNVNLADQETVHCDNCGGAFFRQVAIIKRVPKMLVGAPTDVPVQIPIWRCDDCGQPLDDFLPPGIDSIGELIGTKED